MAIPGMNPANILDYLNVLRKKKQLGIPQLNTMYRTKYEPNESGILIL